MPFVNIRIIDKALGENPKAKKEEIGKSVTDMLHAATGIPKDGIWVVFENVEPSDWQVGGETVEAMWRRS